MVLLITSPDIEEFNLYVYLHCVLSTNIRLSKLLVYCKCVIQFSTKRVNTQNLISVMLTSIIFRGPSLQKRIQHISGIRKCTHDMMYDQHKFWEDVRRNQTPITYASYQLKMLENQKEILEAQKMVSMMFYENNVTWEESYNPSGLERKYDTDGQSYIIDAMEKNCVWGGAFNNDRLVACARLSYKRGNARLDIEKHSINEKIRELVSKTNVVEMQRGFTVPSHRGKGLNKQLFGLFARYSIKLGVEIVVAFRDPYFKRNNIGLTVDDEFYYRDGERLSFEHFPQKELEKVVAYVEEHD
ncbi:uncharacterized protein LOC130648702 [Hydractinia symbiolongicarpus]|uniref:uncharacterized protein LOC130648702 n=1 Tax=Hydractinia symbiolongicarpus TaxID=13093 RepID=UPI00254F8B91|nr:uncharacterized protein LOC130648702 [Hydractinia symbiolongicarpus]XP_057310748.1 uncharacterized protein LOC130648702 [Hydractinia symbiolongicarpus]XP_057310750.1 uncharacterized protein LOC130648702 [Hydractinia symbiolongicarpus]XP_057310751.1 uncharacterized protein LOC130648702 [Hydractinia symbiolongicarpus]